LAWIGFQLDKLTVVFATAAAFCIVTSPGNQYNAPSGSVERQLQEGHMAVGVEKILCILFVKSSNAKCKHNVCKTLRYLLINLTKTPTVHTEEIDTINSPTNDKLLIDVGLEGVPGVN
jgi:hypothetical protein